MEQRAAVVLRLMEQRILAAAQAAEGMALAVI
jgi:hypothetical protein